MRAVVDTHVLIWWIGGAGERLSERQLGVLRDPGTELYWSVVSTVEIGALIAKQKIRLDRPLEDWCQHWVGSLGMQFVGVDHAAALRCATLRYHHGDPIDRMLVAQALELDAAIVTRDRRIAQYTVRVVT